jgi:hypothetical protein
MSESVAQIASQLLSLAPADRAELAQVLWASVEPTEPDEESIALALRRHRELVEGRVAGRSHDEVMEAARRIASCK